MTLFAVVAMPHIGSWNVSSASAQELTEEMLDEAARRTGLSKQELIRRFEQQKRLNAAKTDTSGSHEPGRKSLSGTDDRVGRGQTPDEPVEPESRAILPFDLELEELIAFEDSLLDVSFDLSDSVSVFGSDFFSLDLGTFEPPSFGPVPGDYLLGVGDELIITVWGQVEFQLSRIIDRDGTIVIPKGGKIYCEGQTLERVEDTLQTRLADSYSSMKAINGDDGRLTQVQVSLGQLRAIRAFVVGEVNRPGSYEMSAVSTVLGALYAAGGPNSSGTLRAIRLVRGNETVAVLDLYEYLLGGDRSGDKVLREGDTVYVDNVRRRVRIQGAVRRPMFYEVLPGETAADLVGFAGGLTALAAPDVIHIQRIVPADQRVDGAPDQVQFDAAYDAKTGKCLDPVAAELFDGDLVEVQSIDEERFARWVEVKGSVKQPGIYQFTPGMHALDLIEKAGGLWQDALRERAIIDRTSEIGDWSSVSVPLQSILDGSVAPTPLQDQDVLEVFQRWDVQERALVHISGRVREPMDVEYREGMTLRDLVLKAGGFHVTADMYKAEIGRVNMSSATNRNTSARPEQATQVLEVVLGDDFLTREDSILLQPSDRVYVRALPWWEWQRTVNIKGEVFYPGTYSLSRKDETLSSVIARAGGLKPDAYVPGARIKRPKDDVGNIAINLAEVLANPGSPFDITLEQGDEILIPEIMNTVKVVGEVGFPTSLVYEAGRGIDYYVHRAGGYLNLADEERTRVIHPNGLSLPNQGSSQVVAGSTIIVPEKPPKAGRSGLEVAKDITAIVAGLATIWLIVDR